MYTSGQIGKAEIDYRNSLNSQAVLFFENVTKSYGNKVVLSNFTRTLHKGERIIVTGPNGSGKTTLLAIAAGFSQDICF